MKMDEFRVKAMCATVEPFSHSYPNVEVSKSGTCMTCMTQILRMVDLEGQLSAKEIGRSQKESW